MSAWRERTAVPGGRTYVARKHPYAELLGGFGDDTSVIVWRTHDVDVASVLAGDVWENENGGPLPGSVTVGWFKTVPWDGSGYGYAGSVVYAAPRSNGASPGVMFE